MENHVYFPKFEDFCYYLDYSPEEDLDKHISVEIVTKILQFFWNQNIPAVASGDYTDELPLNGGYDKRAPWPN